MPVLIDPLSLTKTCKKLKIDCRGCYCPNASLLKLKTEQDSTKFRRSYARTRFEISNFIYPKLSTSAKMIDR